MEMMKGFTLMEILIAVMIMSIVTAVGLTSFNFSLQKSRDSQRKSDLALLTKALQAYANDFGHFPSDDGSGGILGCDYDNSVKDGGAFQKCVNASSFSVYLNGGQQVYLPKVPYEPLSDYKYYYIKNGTTGFSLFSILENTKDPFYSDDAGIDYGPNTIYCGTSELCHYEVTEGGAK